MEAKLFICTVIMANKYRYNYGRQANKTLPDLELKLPVTDKDIPDWEFMEKYIKSSHSKPLTTKNNNKKIPVLNVDKWEEFIFDKLFIIKRGSSLYIADSEKGNTPYASASGENNGISDHLNVQPNRTGNCLVINYDGSIGDSYYQPEPFFASEKIVTVTIKNKDMNSYIALFLASVIKKEKYRFSYGRKWTVESTMKESIIKLPIQYRNGKPVIDKKLGYSKEGYIPDWRFMEDYIKALPYGDRI